MATALWETTQQHLDETLVPGDSHGEKAALPGTEKREAVELAALNRDACPADQQEWQLSLSA